MSLVVSQGCYQGTAEEFNRWRARLAETVGMNLRSMEGFGGRVKWSSLQPDVLYLLLNHADNKGDIPWKYTLPLADRLSGLLDFASEQRDLFPMFQRGQKYHAVTEQFIQGLMAAHIKKKRVEFY